MIQPNLLAKIRPATEQESVFLTKITQLDLEPIMFRMVKHYDSLWDIDKTIRVAHLFKCFLWLVYKYPNAAIVPTQDIDKFWHEYLGDNSKYNPETTDLYGHILVHFGYYGMRGEADAQHRNKSFEFTLSLFQEQFGEFPYLLGNASDCGADCLFPDISANCGADCLFEGRLAQSGVDMKRPTLANL